MTDDSTEGSMRVINGRIAALYVVGFGLASFALAEVFNLPHEIGLFSAMAASIVVLAYASYEGRPGP